MPRHTNRFEVKAYLQGIIGTAVSLNEAKRIGDKFIEQTGQPAYICEQGDYVRGYRLANYGNGWIKRRGNDHILAHTER